MSTMPTSVSPTVSTPTFAIKSHNLFSTQSWLAWYINFNYYNNIHYVYCAPFFHNNNFGGPTGPQPGSSCPHILWRDLSEAVARRDPQAATIKNNRRGLISGMTAKFSAGVITAAQHQEISDIISLSETDERLFKPVVFVIPSSKCLHLLQKVPISKKPFVGSQEYFIPDLDGSTFDVQEFLV